MLSMAAVVDVLAKSHAVRLHFAEFQRASRSLRPLRLAVLREVAPPSFSSFCVLVITLEQECKVEHRICIVWGGSQSGAQAIDGSFRLALIVQQVGEIIPSLCKQRISARRCTKSRFRFNFAAISPKHIAKVERCGRISGIALHQDAIEALGLSTVSGLLCRLCLLKQNVGILLRWINRQYKLSALIGSPLGLLDLDGVSSGGMQPQIGQVGFRKPFPNRLHAANDLGQCNTLAKQLGNLSGARQIAKPE